MLFHLEVFDHLEVLHHLEVSNHLDQHWQELGALLQSFRHDRREKSEAVSLWGTDAGLTKLDRWSRY